MTNVLFICGKARRRSPTAAQLAARWPGVTADFAGLSRDADEPLTPEHLAWADMILVMEPRQKKRLASLFGSPRPGVNVVALNIPDRYDVKDQGLIDELTRQLTHHFGTPA